MRIALLVVVASLALAGCTSSSSGDEAGSSQSKSYSVPVLAGHDVNGDARTITLKVSQGGSDLKTLTYSTAGKAKTPVGSSSGYDVIGTITAAAGALKIQAFEGSNPLNFKSIDPSKCTGPNFEVHVVDGAVHLTSSCD